MADQTLSDTGVGLRQRKALIRTLSALLWCLDHWILVFALLLGVFNLLPFLAPVFMRLNWETPARLIYLLYSPMCHQMAQRSFFLFGAQPMYNIADLPVTLTGGKLAEMEALRAFIGSADWGWKVAWSDRMVYMFGGLWLAGIAYGLLRRRCVIQPVSVIGFVILLFPMLIDGGTHLISDMAGGLTGGFRYENQWLAALTGHALPTWFYVGDALGSFNSWMRLISGLAFGVGSVWLAYPYLDRSITETAETLRAKLIRARQPMILRREP
jgi:uncharacterized membrane protein